MILLPAIRYIKYKANKILNSIFTNDMKGGELLQI